MRAHDPHRAFGVNKKGDTVPFTGIAPSSFEYQNLLTWFTVDGLPSLNPSKGVLFASGPARDVILTILCVSALGKSGNTSAPSIGWLELPNYAIIDVVEEFRIEALRALANSVETEVRKPVMAVFDTLFSGKRNAPLRAQLTARALNAFFADAETVIGDAGTKHHRRGGSRGGHRER